MSVPVRELPPLRVKILGDNSSFKASANQAMAIAQQLQRAINGMAFSPSVRSVARAVRLGTGAAVQVIATNVRNVAQQIASMQTSTAVPAATRRAVNIAVQAMIRKATQAISGMVFNPNVSSIQAAVRQGANAAVQVVTRSVLNVARQLATLQINIPIPTATRRAVNAAVRAMLQGATQAVNTVATQIGSQRGLARYARTQLTAATRTAIQGITNAATRAITAGVAGINTASLSRQMSRQWTAAMRRAFANMRFNPQGPNGGGGGRGAGGFGGLGDRADIYMHANALRALAGNVAPIIRSAAEFQRMTGQLVGFTGGINEAKAAMEALQKEALVSPYGIKALGEASRLMMSYGMNVQLSLGVTKMLGDVAGGSNEKLQRLALAMGQVNSMGKLQGQELRQLTEHGFNPLMTIAQQMAKDKSVEGVKKEYAKLDALKRQGKITSEMVVAALKVETSQGGRFAGMAARMSQDVMGLTQQILELVDLIGRKFMETLMKDTEDALKVTLQYLRALAKWVSENKEQAKAIALMVAKVVIAVAAFHMLGFAVALVRWQFRSLFVIWGAIQMLVAPLVGGIRLIIAAIASLRSGLLLTQIAAWAAWLAALGPIPIVIAAIAGVVAAIAGLLVVLVHPGGLKGAFHDCMVALYNFSVGTAGFFYNFQENASKLIDWFTNEWRNMLSDLTTMSMDILTGDMAHWMAVELKTKGPGLNFNMPGSLEEMFGMQLEPMPGVPPIPEQETHDWAGMMGKGKGGGMSTPKAPLYQSADHSKMMYANMMGSLARAKGGEGKKDKQDVANKLLDRIEKNTRSSSPVNLNPASLVGAGE